MTLDEALAQLNLSRLRCVAGIYEENGRWIAVAQGTEKTTGRFGQDVTVTVWQQRDLGPVESDSSTQTATRGRTRA